MKLQKWLVAALLSVVVPLPFGYGAELPEETTKIRTPAGGVIGSELALDRDTIVSGFGPLLFDRSTDGVEGWGLAVDLDAGSPPAVVDGDTLIVDGAEEARVYERNAGGSGAWGLVATLVPSDQHSLDLFGSAIAISGDTAVIGAPKNDDDGINSGSAYIFQRDHGGPGAWGEVAKLTASDAATTDEFGDGVAIDGDTVIVVAPKHDDHGGVGNRGAAYVFERDHGGPDAWDEVTEAQAPTGKYLGRAGALDLSGDLLIANANNSLSTIGPLFIFERDEGGPDAWDVAAELVPSDPQGTSSFGDAVTVLGNLAAVGAPRYDDGAELADAGAVYLFERGEGASVGWTELARLTASDAASGDNFGRAVALAQATLAIGADEVAGEGAIYVFDFPAPVGGTVQGVTPERLTCQNTTQGSVVIVELTEPSWNCEALGLVVAPGDVVTMRVFGTATGAEPIGGTVLGQVNRQLTCSNRTLGQAFRVAMDGATTWNCETEGLQAMPGDKVQQIVAGQKR